MLRNGDMVKIAYSKQLSEFGLAELIGKKAMVTQIVTKDGHVKGVYLIPSTGKLKREEWYVPIQSIRSQQTIDRMRSEQILRKAKI